MTISISRRIMFAVLASLTFFAVFSVASASAAPYYVKTGTRVFINVDNPTQTVFGSGVDDGVDTVILPFSVYSSGQSYNELSIGVNGYFGYGNNLEDTSAGFSDTSNESAVGNSPVVYVHATDLATPYGGNTLDTSIKTEIQQLQTGKAFIIEWDVVNCCDTIGPDNPGVTVTAATRIQAVLYENSDRVDVRYGPNAAQLWPGYQALKTAPGSVVRAGSQSESFPAESTQTTYTSVSLNGPKFSNQSPSYTGIADPNGSSIRYNFYNYSETPSKSGTASVDPVTGAYSINVDETDGFGAGDYSLQVEQTGPDGVAINTNEFTTTVDVVPPSSAPFISVGEFTVYKTHFPTFSGFTDNADSDTDAVTVEVFSGTNTSNAPYVTFQPTLTDSGTPSRKTFSTVSPVSLPDGTYTYRAYQSDAAGNKSLYSANQTFRIDTVAPNAPTVNTQPSGLINNPRPTVSGVASADADRYEEVLIRFRTATGGFVADIPATIQPNGSFSGQPAQNLTDGQYQVDVLQQDNAGNGTASAVSSFTVDTTGPAVPVLGQVPFDTKDSTPTLTGTATYAAGATTNNVTVRIYSYATDSYVRTVTVPVATNGSFSTTITPALADGNYAVDVQQADALGNKSTSDPQNFTVDTTVPSASVSSPTDNSSSSDSTPTFSGAASSASGDSSQVEVLIYSGTTATGSPVQSLLGNVSNGQYSVTAAELTPGQYTATVSQSDAAGNQVTRTVHFTVTIAPTDLQIALQSSAGAVTVGDSVTHTVTVVNNGPKTQGVVVRYNIPSGAVVTDVVTSQGTCDVGSSVITCSLGFLPQEGQAVVYVTLKTTAAGTLSTSASVSSPASDTNSANNAGSNSVTVNPASGGNGGGGNTDTKPKPPVTSPNTSTPSKAISQTAVVLTGTINPGGAPTQYYFEYGTGTKYTGRTPVQTVSGSSPVNVSVPLNGLQLGTSYHFRLVAVNEEGRVVGNDQVIKTIGKLGPKALILQVKKAVAKKAKGKKAKKATKKAPFTLNVTGKLSRPAAVAAKAACAKGRVQVTFSDGKKVVYKKTVKLSKKCTYKLVVTLKTKKQLGKKRKVVARAQYKGNTVLKSKYSKKLTVKTK